MTDNSYIGTTEVEQEDSPYKGYTPAQMALETVAAYGQIDGEHHKEWVLDQVARILNGALITYFKREWTHSEPEYGFIVGESDEYLAWVTEMRGEYDEEEGDYAYSYSEGIAP